MRLRNMRVLCPALLLALNTYTTTARHVPRSRGHDASRDTLERADRSNRVVRLPPLVPPRNGESSFVARQVRLNNPVYRC